MAETTQTDVNKPRKKRKNTKSELISWDYSPPVFFYERLSPMSDKAISNFCREMVAWAQLSTSLVFSRFFSERKPPMVMSDVYKKMENNEELRDTVTLVKQILAGRREQGSIEYKYNFAAIRETQPLYDPEYRLWKLEAIKNTADNIEKIVILPAIPNPNKEEE